MEGDNNFIEEVHHKKLLSCHLELKFEYGFNAIFKFIYWLISSAQAFDF